jgi:hypothetical protein
MAQISGALAEEAYRQAGIELITVDRSDLRALKKRDRNTIEKYTK